MSSKVKRVLDLYSDFINNKLVTKKDKAFKHNVDERTIQRDIDDIREYIEEESYGNSVIKYSKKENGYTISGLDNEKLPEKDILAICKILIDSRAFPKKKIESMINSLMYYVEDKEVISNLISNEIFNYVELRHKKDVTDMLWELGKAINKNNYIEIEYVKQGKEKRVKRILKPLAIIFSEYYFYLLAFIDDEEIKKNFDVINDSFPTIYRVDRIENIKILEDKFRIPYKNRFEEGEFRKRVQFMYGGKIEKITFKYTGKNIDSILDRLPTAEVVSSDGKEYIIKAEVFGKGIDMWIRSQGEYITVLERN